MISPMELKENDRIKYNLNNIVREIDDLIKKQHGFQYYERCVLEESLPLHIRNDIAGLYVKAGWKYVYHVTKHELKKDENGTIFILSEYLLEEFANYFRVNENNNPACLKAPFIVSKDGDIYE